MSPNSTIAAGYVSALLDFAVSLGADRIELANGVGLNQISLGDQDSRVPLNLYLELLKASIASSNQPALALQFGATAKMADMSIMGLIGAAAETVGESRAQINRYSRLMLDAGENDLVGLEVVRDRHGVWMEFRGAVYADHPHLVEAGFARAICGARALLKDTAYFQRTKFPHTIHFKHAEPSYRSEYDRIFGVPLVFSSDRNAFLIDDEFLAIKLPSAHRYMFGVLSERAEVLLRTLRETKTMRGRVEALLIPKLHTGDISVEWASAQLGVSRQTLFRKLKAEQATFESVLDELRHKMALNYLNEKKVSVTEAAYLVGFTDASSFSRAFKRWTGRSPSASRGM